MYLFGKKADSTWMTLHMPDEIAYGNFSAAGCSESRFLKASRDWTVYLADGVSPTG